MAHSGLTLLLSAVCLFLQVTSAATMTERTSPNVDGAGSSIVRRETPDVRLSPKGHVLTGPGHHHSHKHGHKHHVKHAHHHKHKAKAVTKPVGRAQTDISAEEQAKLAVSYCDYDFPIGDITTGTCDASKNHTIILSESMCLEAGIKSGAGTSHANFVIDAANRQFYPKGCVKATCGTDKSANGVCYFYNPCEGPQCGTANFRGPPVCQRKKYMQGTALSDGTCPDSDYTTIQNEDWCRMTANCLGDAAGSEFRIGVTNSDDKQQYSQYCMIDTNGDNNGGKNKVYYNNRAAKVSAAVKGTPLCQVKEMVQWNDDGTQGSTDSNHYENTNATAAKDTAGNVIG